MFRIEFGSTGIGKRSEPQKVNLEEQVEVIVKRSSYLIP